MMSIIIPTYNERENILLLIHSILAVIRKNKWEAEIIVVDDNSPDKTGEIVKKEYRGNNLIKIFTRKYERGLATAILYGIAEAKGDIIIGIDADFNHPPELMPQLIQKLDVSDLVVASRFIKGGGMDEKGRYIGTYLFNYLLKHIFGFPTMDNMSGYYATRKKTLLKFNLKEIYRGYGEYHLRLIWHALQLKLKITEIPVYYKKRVYGKSKSHLLKMLFSYLVCVLTLRLKNTSSAIV